MKRVFLGILLILLSASAYGQVSAALMPQPRQQYFDNAGNLCAGCKIYSYKAGTTSPLATFTDSTATSKNANPTILDASGRASLWLGPYYYKIILKTAGDVTIWTVDNVGVTAFDTIVSTDAIVWGAITGTLSTQSDLQTALAAKAASTAAITFNGTPYALSQSYTLSTKTVCQIDLDGSGTSSVLVAGDVRPNECFNGFGATITLTGISCLRDAGATTVQLATISGNLLNPACSPTNASWQTCTLNGSPTITSGQAVSATMPSIDGVSTTIHCAITGTRPLF